MQQTQAGGRPVFVVNQGAQRDIGLKAQRNNIGATKAIADVIRTCLGPRAAIKMLINPMGTLVLTNDGNSILREVDVGHPAAKAMLELSRAQDESVGDGTTSAVMLAGELMMGALPHLERNVHPTQVVAGYQAALSDAIDATEELAVPVDIDDDVMMTRLIQSSLGTKFTSRWSELMCNLALKAVKRVRITLPDGRQEIDIKRYARVEKVPGGALEDSVVLDGVMINKDIIHSKMRRHIKNPRILLLDCPIEYKKAESQTNVELLEENDFQAILAAEEAYIEEMCHTILEFKPDLIIVEKGVSDLAQHFFVQNNVSVIRRLQKGHMNRIARATGATVVHRVAEITEDDIGTECGLFNIEKIADEYFTYLTECTSPKACTILLRGASRDIMDEVERNLQDAMNVARNVVWDPRLLAGGGATEMALASIIRKNARSISGVQSGPYSVIADALESIPRTLAQNCGAKVIKVITELRAKHEQPDCETWGIHGTKGVIADVNSPELGIWEPREVKVQVIKGAIELACMLLRVDDVVSGITKNKQAGSSPLAQPQAPREATAEDMENAGLSHHM